MIPHILVSPRWLAAVAVASLAVTAVCSAGTPVIAAAGRDDPAVRRELSADYARLTDAFQKRDPSVMEHLMTPDYTAFGAEGKSATRAQVIADFQQQMRAMHDVHWRRTITELEVEGRRATATVEGHLMGKMHGRDGADHALTFDATTEDHWISGGPGKEWKLQRSRVLTTAMRFDGKPVVAGGGGGRPKNAVGGSTVKPR